MWEVIAFGLVVTIVVAFTVWRSYKHGELRKFIEFMKVAAKANDDLFEGEIKTFVLDANGAERTVRRQNRERCSQQYICIIVSFEQALFWPSTRDRPSP